MIISSIITIEIAIIIKHIPILFTKGLSNRITFKTSSAPSKINENKNKIVSLSIFNIKPYK